MTSASATSSPQPPQAQRPSALHSTRQIDPPYRPADKVALFIPCYMDQFNPEIGQAMVRLFNHLGVQVDFPAGQTCCGQPAFNSGYWEESRGVVNYFCDVFESYRWIVCPSGSCSSMCRVFFPLLETSAKATQVGQRVFEFTEFLVDVLGVTDTGASFPHKVAMHYGCHGRRELGILDQPLTLLKNVRGLTYCEIPDSDECCGFGGTFSVKMAGTSLAMGCSKKENIQKCGAEVVASGDISCLMHIGGIIRRDPAMQRVRIMHLAEILASGIS